MATQTLYEKIIRSPEKLNWGDFLNGFSEKHTEADSDYAMIAGTTLDSVQTETGMIQKWQRPWLYRRFLIGGIIGSLLLMLAVVVYMMIFGYCVNACLNLLVLLIPACVIPVTLMVFFWEMNAPRNISLAQLLGYFFAGGIFSLLVSLIFAQWIGSDAAWMAPFAEEPGKFIIAAFFIVLLRKKRGKIYGLSGLAIGAAVGAGFAAFETAQYCFSGWSVAYLNILATYGTSDAEIINALISNLQNGLLFFNMPIFQYVCSLVAKRSVYALASHVLYCAPYSCMFALYLEKKNSIAGAILNVNFLIAFGISFFTHMFWNALNISPFILLIPAVVVLWFSALRGVRLSFAQIVEKIQVVGSSGSSSNAVTDLKIRGVAGVHAGISFKLTHNEILMGSDPSCQLSYPISTANISPMHCKLLIQNGALYLADLGSQSGTFLNGTRIKPMKGLLLKKGDVFWIGSENEKFTVV